MSRIVFLLEEYSMKVFLEQFLPRHFPNLEFLCVPHEGKRDLEKSIPRKLKSWREPGVRFLVVRDNDGGDCVALKRRLVRLCQEAGRDDVVVRIACQELEAWYFGDCAALARAFEQPGLGQLAGKQRYRDPDSIPQPGRAIGDIVERFQKVSGARTMGRHLSAESTSHSFQVFFESVARLHRSMGSAW